VSRSQGRAALCRVLCPTAAVISLLTCQHTATVLVYLRKAGIKVAAATSSMSHAFRRFVWSKTWTPCVERTSVRLFICDLLRALLKYYTASTGNPLPTFRENVSVPSSRVKKYKNTFGVKNDAADSGRSLNMIGVYLDRREPSSRNTSHCRLHVRYLIVINHRINPALWRMLTC
jgi:hypothetical protein